MPTLMSRFKELAMRYSGTSDLALVDEFYTKTLSTLPSETAEKLFRELTEAESAETETEARAEEAIEQDYPEFEGVLTLDESPPLQRETSRFVVVAPAGFAAAASKKAESY